MHGCGNIIKRSRGKEQTQTWHIIKFDVTFTHYRPVLTSKGGFTLSDFSEVAFPLSSVTLLHYSSPDRVCNKADRSVCCSSGRSSSARRPSSSAPGLESLGTFRNIFHDISGEAFAVDSNTILIKVEWGQYLNIDFFYHFMHSIIVSFKYPGIYLRRRGEFRQKDIGQDSNPFVSRDPTLSSWPDLLANPLGLGSGCFR